MKSQVPVSSSSRNKDVQMPGPWPLIQRAWGSSPSCADAVDFDLTHLCDRHYNTQVGGVFCELEIGGPQLSL